MEIASSKLNIGEMAIITNVNVDAIPLKLIEMGCLPSNTIKLLLKAPLGDPYYFIINDSHVAIRKETAENIIVEKLVING